jgi:hypothetical protein
MRLLALEEKWNSKVRPNKMPAKGALFLPSIRLKRPRKKQVTIPERLSFAGNADVANASPASFDGACTDYAKPVTRPGRILDIDEHKILLALGQSFHLSQ